MNKQNKIYVAGHTGLVGSALIRTLKKNGFEHIVTRTAEQLDLRNQSETNRFFHSEKPEFVFLAAAKVGGIGANASYPAEFIYDNLMIQNNVIHAAYMNNIQKLLFLGSSCIYPRNCPQPIKEEYLLTDTLEPTNEPYAIAKIAGIKLCQSYNRQYKTNFISCMPTNLYGPGDNFNLETSHVVPALIAKIYSAKLENKSHVSIWGTGKPLREFLFVDDLASAALFLMQNYAGNIPINIGTGKDITIKQLATKIKQLLHFNGTLVFDSSRPDGTPRKLLDISRLSSLGWKAQTTIEKGLQKTIEWYQGQMQNHTQHVNTKQKEVL